MHEGFEIGLFLKAILADACWWSLISHTQLKFLNLLIFIWHPQEMGEIYAWNGHHPNPRLRLGGPNDDLIQWVHSRAGNWRPHVWSKSFLRRFVGHIAALVQSTVTSMGNNMIILMHYHHVFLLCDFLHNIVICLKYWKKSQKYS